MLPKLGLGEERGKRDMKESLSNATHSNSWAYDGNVGIESAVRCQLTMLPSAHLVYRRGGFGKDCCPYFIRVDSRVGLGFEAVFRNECCLNFKQSPVSIRICHQNPRYYAASGTRHGSCRSPVFNAERLNGMPMPLFRLSI